MVGAAHYSGASGAGAGGGAISISVCCDKMYSSSRTADKMIQARKSLRPFWPPAVHPAPHRRPGTFPSIADEPQRGLPISHLTVSQSSILFSIRPSTRPVSFSQAR